MLLCYAVKPKGVKYQIVHPKEWIFIAYQDWKNISLVNIKQF